MGTCWFSLWDLGTTEVGGRWPYQSTSLRLSLRARGARPFLSALLKVVLKCSYPVRVTLLANFLDAIDR